MFVVSKIENSENLSTNLQKQSLINNVIALQYKIKNLINVEKSEKQSKRKK